MNTPNPLHPQGAFPDTRGRSHVRIAVFTILAVHVVLLGALLLQGCKRTTTEPEGTEDLASSLPPFEPTTNVYTPPPDIRTFTPPPEVIPAPPPSSPSPVTTTPPPVETFTPPPPEIVPPAPPPEEVKPPAAPPPPPVAPPASNREHIVVQNDSFYSLGQQYGVSWKAIAAANPGVDSRRLKIGQPLVIPPAPVPVPEEVAPDTSTGVVYRVKSGDTLTRIAKKYGTKIKTLRDENRLPTDRLVVGQKLKIPATATNLSGAKP